jgi:hypothetical protein
MQFPRAVLFALSASLAIIQSAWCDFTGQWKFNGNCTNSLGTNNGTFVGTAVYTIGFLNQAISLDGFDHLDLGASAISTNAYTKAAWICRTGTGNNNIFSGYSTNGGHALFVPEGNGYSLAAGHNGTWTSVIDNVAIAPGVWTHVAVTYDAAVSGGTLKLYRNGRLAGGTAVATNIAPPTGAVAWIGGFLSAGHGLVGQLDDVGLWDRGLSAAEIEQIYKAGAHGVELPDANHFHYRVYDLVPEAAGMDVVYDLMIPNQSSLGSTGKAAYVWDNSGSYTNGVTFDRLAYYIELVANGAGTSQWVYVSMDPFTRDATKLGVPAYATGAQFQQSLTNVNVFAGDSYVTSGTNLQTGNIEFWGLNYNARNGAGVPNASDTLWDVGDQPAASGYYGSMQIHNHAVNGTTATQTIFAYNRWGYGDTSELGIGNDPNTGRANYNPDWTFAQNANLYDSKFLLVLARKIPTVAFVHCPKPLQLYPRSLGTTQANVLIQGAVTSSDCTQISVSVTRSGVAYTNLMQSLTYTAGQAEFSFSVPIVAELADYDFTVQVIRDSIDYTVATVTNVVAGDVFLINGQSNAEARSFNGSANGNQSNWLRSYGCRSSTNSYVQADATWHLAEGDAWHGPGAVGQWGLRMGRMLVESNAIPVCIINHAEGGQPISYFQRNDSDPDDLTANYGQLLYRVRQASLTNAVRAILWYQGESDNGNGIVHENGFLEMYRRWLSDYPAVEKVYVCQLHVGCGQFVSVWPAELRNRQRLWPDTYSNIVVMSTTGLPQRTEDYCHYAYDTGYRVLGEQLSRLVLRDLYGATQPSQIAPPNIEFAYFSDPTGTNVTIVTRNSEDQLTLDSGARADFRLEGGVLTNVTVLAANASGNVIQLTFSMDARLATGISYSGHIGGAPYITNSLGIGLLSFHNQPILTGLVTPDIPEGLQTIVVCSNRIDLAWASVTNASHYLIRRDGIDIATAYQPFFIDTITGTHDYQIAAVSLVGTSAWSSAVSACTAAHNVFTLVPEASDYAILFQLDLAGDFRAGSTLDMPYAIDNSGIYTQGIQRVAYYMELQDRPGSPLRWVYTSMPAFTNRASLLGVPVVAKGVTFQSIVTDLNVCASANSGIVTGQHIATGNIEFWGLNYNARNGAGVPNASDTLRDVGDQPAASGYYGSMQMHNHAVNGTTATQTIFAYNQWGSTGTDDIGIGNDPNTGRVNYNPDWTFASNALSWNMKRLYVLVQTDANANNLPDAWELLHFDSLNEPDGGPDDDPDGDGFSNRQEYLAGTDPNDAHNVLRVDTPQRSGKDVIIRFPTIVGRSYIVEYKDALTERQWHPAATVEGTGGIVQVPDAGAALLPKRFYQVRVVP